jgi:hypothetical protein
MMKILSSIALASLVVGCGNQNSKVDAAESESEIMDSLEPNYTPPISVLQEKGCSKNIGYKRLIEFLVTDGLGDELGEINACNENLRGLKAPSAKFEASDFRGASLSNADLTNASFPDVDFRGAFFAYTNMSGVFLAGTKFGCDSSIVPKLDSCSEFLGTNFSNSKMYNTDFSRSIIGAPIILTGSTLEDVDFSQVEGLTDDQVKDAKKICGVKFPKEVTISGDRDCVKPAP